VQKVRWVPSSGSLDHFFDDELVPASRGVQEAMLRKIEPFPTTKNWCPTTRAIFPAGWWSVIKSTWSPPRRKPARKWTRKWNVCAVRRASARRHASKFAGGERLFRADLQTHPDPIWLLTYNYGTRHFQVVINGYTGVIAGKYPKSWVKITLAVLAFQTTSLKIRPGLNFIDITTKDLADYPFVYMAGSGQAVFTDEEAAALRAYLLNGGFLMADDFWGDDQWEHFAEQVKHIFPDRAPELMSLTNQIFHTVFDFKKQPQIPSAFFDSRYQSYDPGYRYEQMNHDPHYYGVYDDKRRLMMLICHNNHYGDGWEHEGDDETYFAHGQRPVRAAGLTSSTNSSICRHRPDSGSVVGENLC
jgi:hypothetical protein